MYLDTDIDLDRARRVKCDETRPACLRCFASERLCEGYRDQKVRGCQGVDKLELLPVHPAKKSFSPAIRCLHQSSRDAYFCRLALETLLQDSYERTSWQTKPTWLLFLAQMIPSSQVIADAMALLGVVCGSAFRLCDKIEPQLVFVHKDKALRSLKGALNDVMHDPVSVFFASVLFAATAILQKQYTVALMHTRAVYKLLQYLSPHRGHRNTNDSYRPLHRFAQSLDLQTAWYFLAEPPSLSSSFDPILPNRLCTKYFCKADDDTVADLLHSCYHFARRAASYKYASQQPAELVLEQSRYIAALSRYIAEAQWAGDIPSESISTGMHRTVLIRTVQCLSTLIYLSSTLSPYEINYDLYAKQFDMIITLSETIRQATRFAIDSTTSLPIFQLQPGVFQALYLTAMKYRHAVQRRIALSLLRDLGIEGPWNAQVMSRIAEEAIDVEERGVQVSENGNLQVPERQRLHGVGLDDKTALDAEVMGVEVHYSLCRDVAEMLRDGNFDDPKHWELWSETLEISHFGV